MTIEQRSEELNTLFKEQLMPLMREVSAATTQAQADEQLFYQQYLEHTTRRDKADNLKQ